MGAYDIESLLDDARRAALAEGLTRIMRMHLRVGPKAGIAGDDLQARLTGRFRGTLFESCTVTWEPCESGGITLASIEGYELSR